MVIKLYNIIVCIFGFGPQTSGKRALSTFVYSFNYAYPVITGYFCDVPDRLPGPAAVYFV